jgi:hypothetical protein
MTNHHSGPSAVEEIYPILPVFVGLPTDEVAAVQDYPTVAVKKADTATRPFICEHFRAPVQAQLRPRR